MYIYIYIYIYIYRGSQQRCSVKIGVLRNFAKIHRKTPVPETLL